jgi:hypothetical protein
LQEAVQTLETARARDARLLAEASAAAKTAAAAAAAAAPASGTSPALDRVRVGQEAAGSAPSPAASPRGDDANGEKRRTGFLTDAERRDADTQKLMKRVQQLEVRACAFVSDAGLTALLTQTELSTLRAQRGGDSAPGTPKAATPRSTTRQARQEREAPSGGEAGSSGAAQTAPRREGGSAEDASGAADSRASSGAQTKRASAMAMWAAERLQMQTTERQLRTEVELRRVRRACRCARCGVALRRVSRGPGVPSDCVCVRAQLTVLPVPERSVPSCSTALPQRVFVPRRCHKESSAAGHECAAARGVSALPSLRGG